MATVETVETVAAINNKRERTPAAPAVEQTGETVTDKEPADQSEDDFADNDPRARHTIGRRHDPVHDASRTVTARHDLS